MERFDENGDRLIDYDEFKKMMINFHEYFNKDEAEICDVEPSSLGNNSDIDDDRVSNNNRKYLIRQRSKLTSNQIQI